MSVSVSVFVFFLRRFWLRVVFSSFCSPCFLFLFLFPFFLFVFLLFLFVFLFLSVFLPPEKKRRKTTPEGFGDRESIQLGLSATGGTISAAGLILGLTFLALILTSAPRRDRSIGGGRGGKGGEGGWGGRWVGGKVGGGEGEWGGRWVGGKVGGVEGEWGGRWVGGKVGGVEGAGLGEGGVGGWGG